MIEDIQRINKLAQELLDHGITSSREDAVKKAEEMLSKRLIEKDCSRVFSDKQVNQVIADKDKDTDYYKNMAERTKEFMEKELANYKSALNALASEVRSLREQVEKLSARKTEFAAAEAQPHPPVEKQVSLKPKESHPKRGDYKSEDVSVEKMFYYGNK